MPSKKRPVTTLVPWFGTNRTLAENVGKALAGKRWVGVPFAGGMCELAHIDAPTLVVSDLHRWVINLARVVAEDGLRPNLIRQLDAILFHPDELAAAQRQMLKADRDTSLPCHSDVPLAVDYFVTAWMGRSAKAGTDDEFSGSLPVRWNANGGDSNTRYRSAVAALEEWGRIFKRCNFHVRDAFDFLRDVKDEGGHGLYCDPPFPGPGDSYRHKFDEYAQSRLMTEVVSFTECRVVMRFYDHPLIRDLYPESAWKWHRFTGRTQANNAAAEVLIVRN